MVQNAEAYPNPPAAILVDSPLTTHGWDVQLDVQLEKWTHWEITVIFCACKRY